MGQAFNLDDKVLAEAWGKTKKEVFDQLMQKAPDADKILIQKLKCFRENLEEEEV